MIKLICDNPQMLKQFQQMLMHLLWKFHIGHQIIYSIRLVFNKMSIFIEYGLKLIKVKDDVH